MELISRKAVLDGIDKYIEKAQSTGTQDDFISFAELGVKALPSAFEGMTNRDVLNALFPIDENKGERLIKVYLDHEPIESFALTTTQKWLDSPYKGVSE